MYDYNKKNVDVEIDFVLVEKFRQELWLMSYELKKGNN